MPTPNIDLIEANLSGARGNADTVLPVGCGWVVGEDGLIVRAA